MKILYKKISILLSRNIKYKEKNEEYILVQIKKKYWYDFNECIDTQYMYFQDNIFVFIFLNEKSY